MHVIYTMIVRVDREKIFVVRLVKVLVTVWFIVSLVFILTRISGDPTDWMLPDDASLETRMELRESLGLDKPILEQYVIYISDVLHGDMGERLLLSSSSR